jgi:ribosomal protein S15P/S13E
MAHKKKILNSAQKVARRAHKVAQTVKNKAARLAKHVKNHKNDKQAAARVGKPRSERKAPFVKGSAPTANRNYMYVDGAGRHQEAPLFNLGGK